MNIELGDVNEIVQIVKTGVDVCKELSADGTLDGIIHSIGEMHRNIRKHCAQTDIEILHFYEEEGHLSREQALHLLTVSKIAHREMLNTGKNGECCLIGR